MLKRNGQRKEGAPLSPKGKMTDVEYAAFSEVFGAVKGDYQTLCVISDKLREVEMTARGLGSFGTQAHNGHAELPESAGGRSPWEVCASLNQLERNEVLLCKRVCEHGLEYAVIDYSPVTSAYARAHGPLDVLRTGDNPRQVLRDFLRGERETLQLLVNDITANARLLVAERFPKQDLQRVVNEITRMCKSVARLGLSESPAELAPNALKQRRGVRV
jgi:hypothetical protein